MLPQEVKVMAASVACWSALKATTDEAKQGKMHGALHCTSLLQRCANVGPPIAEREDWKRMHSTIVEEWSGSFAELSKKVDVQRIEHVLQKYEEPVRRAITRWDFAETRYTTTTTPSTDVVKDTTEMEAIVVGGKPAIVVLEDLKGQGEAAFSWMDPERAHKVLGTIQHLPKIVPLVHRTGLTLGSMVLASALVCGTLTKRVKAMVTDYYQVDLHDLPAALKAKLDDWQVPVTTNTHTSADTSIAPGAVETGKDTDVIGQPTRKRFKRA